MDVAAYVGRNVSAAHVAVQQRLCNKQKKLEILIDITGVAETWWDNSRDWNVKIHVFDQFRNKWADKRSGGGSPH